MGEGAPAYLVPRMERSYAAIEKIVEGDGVITVYFSSPYEVEVDNIREGFQRISTVLGSNPRLQRI